MVQRRVFRALLFLSVIALVVPLFAQQTGALHGKVQASDNSLLPGVTVEASSNVLPQPRVTTTDTAGEFRLPALIPGNYTVTFTLSGMQTVTRKATVLLGQDQAVDAKLGVAAVSENITVTAEATLVNKESTAIQSGLTGQQIRELPITQDYRDLQKFIPGVQYSQDTVRGPSAGASGQDNIYMFDGANITMPLFGVLNADPNNHDIEQVTVIRGGAKAVDFNRAGGFLIDSVSKSGTNKFLGEVSYEILNKNFIASQTGGQLLTYQQDKSWANANLGGPILSDRLFFYGSFYRPKSTRANQANVYGALPEYRDNRTDVFGKLTFTPTQSWLVNGSYRHSKEDQTAAQFGATSAPTTGTGFRSSQKIATLETSWIINPKSYATAKVYDWRNPGNGSTDQTSGATINLTNGTHLDIANLAQQGRLTVPTPIGSTNAAQTAFVTPFLNQYGYICPQNPSQFNLTCTPGVLTGGSTVGFGQFIHDDDSFFRKNVQAAYNYTLGSRVSHDLHVGFQHYKDAEDRFQTSNGWGLISVPAGVGAAGTCPAGVCGAASTPAFFVAAVSQQGAKAVPPIHSEVVSKNLELNDTIHMNNWSFNVGVLDSQDSLYGQGLASANNVAGFTTSPGTKYLMHRFSWTDMIQPRLGATWAYNGSDTVYTSVARYMPPANSDARAASWDRNLVAQVNAYFDASGNLIGVAPNASSSGKWWEDGIKHPEIKEYMIGTARQLSSRWSSRVYGRYKKGDHYLEDTNNNARSLFNPPAGVPTSDYVPNLCDTSLATCSPTTIRGAIGSGSTYVIANLDGAFTKYYEATAESEWHGDNVTLGGSYTWSHYYGNFDQDNSSFNTANDAAIFIGSSNIGDAAGRQMWDNKYGNLRGDRRNLLKLNGTYILPWRATTGAFFVYQSGQHYQLESALAYRNLTSSTSDTARYAEAAGSRVAPSHRQIDWNYTQNIPIGHGMNFQLVADVFNLFNSQTGYNYETRIGTNGVPSASTLGFIHKTVDSTTPTIPIPDTITDATLKGILSPKDPFVRSEWAVRAPFPQSHYAPRQFQLTARFQF